MSAALAASSADAWISGAEAARVLAISPRALTRVVERTGIRTRSIPGTFTRYHAGDVQRVARESVSVPTDAAPAETAVA